MLQNMTPVSHTTKALDLLPRQLGLVGFELAWRWGFSACLLASYGWMHHRVLARLNVNPYVLTGYSGDPREGGELASAWALVPQMLSEWLILLTLLVIVWCVVSALGRCIVLRRLFAILQSKAEPRPCLWRPLLVVQFAQAACLLLPTGVVCLALALAEFMDDHALSAVRSSAVSLLFLCVALLAMLAWSGCNFFISLLQIELARSGGRLGSAVSALLSMSRQKHALLAREASLNLALRAIVLLTFGVLALLAIAAFMDSLPLTALLLGLILTFFQQMVGDFLLLVRLYSAAAILEEGE